MAGFCKHVPQRGRSALKPGNAIAQPVQRKTGWKKRCWQAAHSTSALGHARQARHWLGSVRRSLLKGDSHVGQRGSMKSIYCRGTRDCHAVWRRGCAVNISCLRTCPPPLIRWLPHAGSLLPLRNRLGCTKRWGAAWKIVCNGFAVHRKHGVTGSLCVEACKHTPWWRSVIRKPSAMWWRWRRACRPWRRRNGPSLGGSQIGAVRKPG